MRIIVAITGSSGALFGVEFLKRAPAEKYLIISKWGKAVLKDETGLSEMDLASHVKRTFQDSDLSAPFSSGSNYFDAFVVIPCSISTLGKIASGIADTLITRIASVALKERRKLILCLRETPLSTIVLQNATQLSQEGAVIMPISPPMYEHPKTIEDLARSFADKVLGVLGLRETPGWNAERLE